MGKQLECRITITHRGQTFALGMYDPHGGRHEKLGVHPNRDREKVIGDLKRSIEGAGHVVTFSEVWGER